MRDRDSIGRAGTDVNWQRSALKGDEALRGVAGDRQAGQIGLHLPVGAERGESRAENGCNSGVGGLNDAVVHPFALAAGADDARPAEIGKMARNLGLALREDLDEIADAKLPAGDQVEKPKAGAVGKGGKERDQERGFRGALHEYKYTP